MYILIWNLVVYSVERPCLAAKAENDGRREHPPKAKRLG